MSESQTAQVVFEPVQVAKRNFEVVAESIRRQIYEGKLRPGQRLPAETELARQFQVGRSAVREALKMLELSGLLSVRRGYNGGTFVAPPDFEDASEAATLTLRLGRTTVEQLVEAREAIEVRAAELAARRATEADVADLRLTIERMQETLRMPARFISADVDFHIAISEMARNNVFLFSLNAIRNLLRQDLNRLIRDVANRPVFIDHHWAIWRAIESRDSAAAGQAMRLHLREIAARLGVDTE